MRMKTPLLAGVLCLASAAPAYACTFYFASTYIGIPARPSFGVGVMAQFSDPSLLGFSGDVAMRLGDKAVVRPAIGLCSYEVLDERQNDPYFGAGVAVNLTQNESMSFNLQSGISYLTLDGGNQVIVPIGAAASFRGSSSMSFYAGASLWWIQNDPDGGDTESETDPVLFGGLRGNAGAMSWTLGGQLYMGDETDFGIVAGLSMNPSASAIRRIGSVFRK